jgi:hypothetical protein
MINVYYSNKNFLQNVSFIKKMCTVKFTMSFDEPYEKCLFSVKLYY